MKNLTPKQVKWLKSFHVLSAGIWIACGTIMLSFSLIAGRARTGGELYMLNFLTDFIDTKILVPAAVFCLLTGLLYSLFTKWGFFKHRWITVKWIITLTIMITGTVLTGPWIARMTDMSKELGMAVLQNDIYRTLNTNQLLLGSVMNATLIFALFISIFKPWKKK